MHENRSLMREHGIPIFAVKRQNFRAISLEDLHALDHRGRRVQLRIAKTSLQRNIIDVLHILQQLIFKTFNHIIDRAITAIERRFGSMGKAKYLGHLNRLHRSCRHKFKDGILDP